MILGTVLVLAALSLFLYNLWDAKQAGDASATVLTHLEKAIADKKAFPILGEEQSAYPDPFDQEMMTIEIDRYDYVGYLTVPPLGLELPIMSEWDYTRLKISPCRYSGSIKTDNLVICAHNYTRHFGRLSDLKAGDTLYFTDVQGNTRAYEVAVVDILAPAAVEEMTAGEYDLTLFTCTYGGASRITVRCISVNTQR